MIFIVSSTLRITDAVIEGRGQRTRTEIRKLFNEKIDGKKQVSMILNTNCLRMVEVQQLFSSPFFRIFHHSN